MINNLLNLIGFKNLKIIISIVIVFFILKSIDWSLIQDYYEIGYLGSIVFELAGAIVFLSFILLFILKLKVGWFLILTHIVFSLVVLCFTIFYDFERINVFIVFKTIVYMLILFTVNIKPITTEFKISKIAQYIGNTVLTLISVMIYLYTMTK